MIRFSAWEVLKQGLSGNKGWTPHWRSPDPQSSYDVIIIDGLYRKQMVPIALDYLSDEGMIIVDNAEGYELYESFKDSGYSKVEFYGFAPGVYLQSCTAVYFKPNCKYIVDNIEIYRPN